MMSRHALMICQCWHAPFGHFVHVAQVREENPGPAAVHGGNVVIRSRGSCFLELGNAPHFNLRPRSSEKKFLRRTFCRLLDQTPYTSAKASARPLSSFE